MGDSRQALNARAMGNYGLWETLRRRPELESGAEDDDPDPRLNARAGELRSRWLRVRGRVIGWSLAAGVVLAYVNHWPGGH